MGSITLGDGDGEPGPETGGTGPAAPAEPRAGGRGEAARRDPVPAPRPVPGGRLAGDPRWPIWIARAVMAVAAGVAITAWQGWRVGVGAAALRALAHPVYPPENNSVIDHLVIGPGGVFALDSERWDRRLPVRSVTGDLLYHGPFSQKERLKHAAWESSQAALHLSNALGQKITVRPAMAIYGPTIPWIVASLDGVDVFSGKRVRKYFRRQARTGSVGRLDAEQIEEIHIAAALALPPAR